MPSVESRSGTYCNQRVVSPGAGSVSVACCEVDPESPETTISMLQDLVSRQRLERANRYHRAQDTLRSMLGEVVARYVVGNVLGLDYSAVQVLNEPSGRPVVQGRPEVWLSISHSGCWVVAAVGHAPLGVDVEPVGAVHHDIAGACFSPGELEYLGAASTEYDAAVRFVRIWTAKESYTKAVGLGLSLDLWSFETFGSEGRCRVTERGATPTRFSTRDVPLGAGHVCTLCSDHAATDVFVKDLNLSGLIREIRDTDG